MDFYDIINTTYGQMREQGIDERHAIASAIISVQPEGSTVLWSSSG